MKHLYNIATFLLALIINSPSVFAQGNSFGYPVTPDTSSASTDPVGSPAGSFAVSPLGAATYTVPIEVPQGLPGATPQIAITYNSQGGNGVAGYGCSISGVSTITRVPRDIYHDGAAAGIDYTADDAFSLDGRRLILIQPAANSDSAVYCIEDNPYARVVFHGLTASSQSATWFSMEDTDGMRYEYSEKLSFSKDGQIWVNSWHLKKAVTPQGNSLMYYYDWNGYCLYLSEIAYGYLNRNYVTFEYEARPDTIRYSMKGCRGWMGRRLKSVTSSSYSNGQQNTYRHYVLEYDDTSDGSTTKFSRLTSVTVGNGDNEEMSPLQLEWENLPAYTADIRVDDIDYYGFHNAQFIEVVDGQSQLMAADLNGDGISDIVQKANVEERPGDGYTHYYTDFYIRTSGHDNQGNIVFGSPQTYRLGAGFSLSNWSVYSEGPMTGDMDGNGLGDLVIPYIETGVNNIAHFYFIYGEDIRDHGNSIYLKNCHLLHSDTTPLYSATDMNGDGMHDIIILETDNTGGDTYDIHIIPGVSSHTSSTNESNCQLSIPSKPEKLFTADFNSDGMPDVMVTYNGGYAIFWNQGGNNLASIVSSTFKLTVSQFLSGYRMYEGDYNGDGILDFLITYTDNSQWRFALGRGDGYFELSVACDIQAYEQSATEKDDSFLNCSVLDIDGDGKTDAVISKAVYARHHDLVSTYYRFDHVNTYWLLSDGKRLVTEVTRTSDEPEHAANQYYMTGDFNGDGLCELANFGYNCYSGSTPANDRITRTYINAAYSPASGRLSAVTDGLGNRTEIAYASLADPSVYTAGNETVQGTACITIPLGVTESTTSANGAAGTENSHFTYGSLRVSLLGKGILGFTAFTTTCQEQGTVISRDVNSWDTETYSPLNVSERTTVNGQVTLRNIVNGKVQPFAGKKAYLSYTDTMTVIDFDGNSIVMTQTYDTGKGVPTYKRTTSSDGISQIAHYEYTPVGTRWLPQTSILTRSSSGSSDYRIKNTYTYDALGQVLTETHNDSTAAAVTTTYTYDSYGNVLSATTQDVASVLESVTKTYQYDPTRRFVTRSVERGYIKHEYTYDLWGNILTDTDKTRPGYPLTTEYDYDGWGNVISTTSPEGLLTTRVMGWGSSLAKRYYVLEQGNARPWVKTWYDSRGREVLTESVAQGDILLQTTSTYNNKGLLTQRKDIRSCTATTLTVTEDFTYDSRGRKLSDVLSTGESTTYSYGNLTVTSTSAGRTWTTRYDMQDNVVETTDPLGTVTSYHYHACGKPLSVTSCGSTVTMEYDDAGRQTALHDPDAGTMRYAYDAYGRVTLQTDARNYKTASTYDDKGRLASTQTYLVNPTNNGYYTTEYTYGQSASDRGLLLSVSKNNGQTLLPPVSISYAYDALGRVSSEQHTYGVSPQKTWTFQYAYNSAGQLSSTTYPSGLQASYAYDAYGNLSSTSAAGQPLEQVQSVTPTQRVTQLGTGLTYSKHYNSRGQLTNALMRRTSDSYVPAVMSFTYDNATAHLTSRSLMIMGTEYFTYDALDRLTGVRIGGSGEEKTFAYAPNGNLIYQTGLGHYYYESTKPHAVTAVDNLDASIPTALLTTSYNNIGKIDIIEDKGTAYKMAFNYGVDNERIQSTLSRIGFPVRTTYYLGDFEEVEENGGTRYFHYLGNNVLYIKQENGQGQPYYMFTDHLGSITCIVDQQGNAVFRASYDAWGRQTVTLNTIGFRRGYTGHEMLPEFGIINMNGRLYDPLIGRFLSTDNFVQEPLNSQNFNRYSYCLNNPLKYRDPNGEFFTWLFGSNGFSIGLNFGLFGFGLNFGYNNFSIGIYGELGPRVGGTGFGSGATISQSLDYSILNESFSTSTGLGVYGSLGGVNVGANVSYTYGNNGGCSWNVNAGVNIIGTDEEGLGLNFGYGSNGWVGGIGGYVNPNAWDDNPEFLPEIWNNENAREYNNCYSYALDYKLEPTQENFDNNGLQPGYTQGKRAELGTNFSSDILSLALADGKIKKPTFWNKLGFGKKGYYEVYLVFTPDDNYIHDYHWYRKDSNGLWSHKPGKQFVSNVDKSGNLIYNPAKANHGIYTQGGFLLWVKR